MQALKKDFNVSYVRVSRIKMDVTNEYGEEVKVPKAGRREHSLHAHEPLPPCLYGLRAV